MDQKQVPPLAMEELELDFEELDPLENFHETDKRRSADYGHLRFGKREEFGDYGHTRFGRSMNSLNV